jgi:hypothetical protein
MARPYPELKPYKGTLPEVEAFFRWLGMNPELQCAETTGEIYGRAIDGRVKHVWHAIVVFFRYYPECAAAAAAVLAGDGSQELPEWPPDLLEGWIDFLHHYEQKHDVGYVFSVLENTLPPDLGGRDMTSAGSSDLVLRLVPLIGAYLKRRW